MKKIIATVILSLVIAATLLAQAIIIIPGTLFLSPRDYAPFVYSGFVEGRAEGVCNTFPYATNMVSTSWAQANGCLFIIALEAQAYLIDPGAFATEASLTRMDTLELLGQSFDTRNCYGSSNSSGPWWSYC